jgi:hypothetical protein
MGRNGPDGLPERRVRPAGVPVSPGGTHAPTVRVLAAGRDEAQR